MILLDVNESQTMTIVMIVTLTTYKRTALEIIIDNDCKHSLIKKS